jgi:ribosomal protein S24E
MTSKNFYYVCIYDILKCRGHPREKTPTSNHLKPKIVRLYSKQVQSIVIDTHEATFFQGESPPLFHLLQMRKSSESWMITTIIEHDGISQMATGGHSAYLS